MQENKNLSRKGAMAKRKATLYLGIAAKEFKNGKTREEVRARLSKCSDEEFNMICDTLSAREAYDKAAEAYDKAVEDFTKQREAYIKCMEENCIKD